MAQWRSVTNSDLLTDLALAYGLSTSYRGSYGDLVSPPRESFIQLLQALDVPLPDEPTQEDLTEALDAWRTQWATRPLPPVVVAREGVEHRFTVHVPEGRPANVWVTLEDGSVSETYQDENWDPPASDGETTYGGATFHIRGDLPLGWHTIHLESDGVEHTCTLVITPEYLHTTNELLAEPCWGVMAQLYSVRSEQSWGIGDFHDLGALAETVAKQGADYLLINPVHAAEPIPPIEDSPYLPTSRRFINPIYIAVEDVEEFAQLDEETREAADDLIAELKATNRSSDFIDRDLIYEIKLAVLQELYDIFLKSGESTARYEEFEAFIAEEGEGLVNFAHWCARVELTRRAEFDAAISEMAADNAADDVDDAAGPRDEIIHINPQHEEELARFYMWLQFLADSQRKDAHDKAIAAGMRIGIMTDLAVGVHPGGADAFTLKDVLVQGASVGAPPDQYSQHGQDWSQPPWNPFALAETGYRPWRDLLRTVLRNSGGIRVDHILGLFRLFWIPRYGSPLEGAYMNYDHEAMLGILALEAERAGAVVVGEDLGTFEPWVQDALRQRGILGTSVLWFETSPPDDGPKTQLEYRNLSLSSVGTHDLPPTAGYLLGAHNELRDSLGIVDDSFEELDAKDVAWQADVLNTVRDSGAFAGTMLNNIIFDGLGRDQRGDVNDIVVGLTSFIANTRSALTCTNLVDMVGDRRIQNQPGTNAEQYKNWCVPLTDAEGTAVLIEDLEGIELFHRMSEASKRSS
nr:4-alpha-glucanotransferase [Corynebacterium aquatimens]